MTTDYSAAPIDFQAIESALEVVWNPKLDFVFQNRAVLKKTVVISYDSKYIYLWSQTKQPGLESIPCNISSYFAYRIPHKLIISSQHHYAWCAGIWQKEIEILLPSSIKNRTRFEVPKISGGLLTPFTTLQHARSLKAWPYATPESYCATIIHEFGHVYWNQSKLWWMSNKKENLNLLHLAHQLYSSKKQLPLKARLYLPTTASIGEIYAFCTEYTTSSFFWPNHKKALDKYYKFRLKELKSREVSKNLAMEDSTIEPDKNPHDFASVYGKIILSNYPSTWPNFLTRTQPLGG